MLTQMTSICLAVDVYLLYTGCQNVNRAFAKTGESTAGGNAHPDDITYLAVDGYLVYTCTSCQNVIRAFANRRQVSLQQEVMLTQTVSHVLMLMHI